jgi:serine/threonine protein kinase/formylglycine-generating enzyme required for sulfatase activity
MNDADAGHIATTHANAAGDRISQVREQFEQAWQAGTVPSIDGFLAINADGGLEVNASRRALLIELVKVDLEQRWRRSGNVAAGTADFKAVESETLVAAAGSTVLPERPALEDYLNCYPILGTAETAPAELIVEEYRVRCLWGDHPSQEAYLKRFSSRSPTLRDGLSKIEAQLDSWRQKTMARDSTGEVDSAAEIINTGGLVVPRESPVPQKIGRYLVERKLAEGGFGAVYLARDTELQRFVAIKVPRASRFVDESAIAKFIDEARTAAALNHPGIVTVFDVGRQEDGSCFVVMEYLPGRSFEDLLSREQLPYMRVVDLMIEVADAVHDAHKHDLVHRDLKPANILFDAEGRPHVADFGLAVNHDARRLLAGEISGTPRYMAPEQVRGETHRLDARTDIWALGVILYEALTGRLAYSGDSLPAMFRAIQQDEPTPPRECDAAIPAALERIVLKCLSKRMADRYASAAKLGLDLKATRGEGTSGDALKRGGSDDKIVPRGLRSFDVRDAGYFISLLPGPTDRHGLPECVRLWKEQIEEIDPEKTFAVGLLYGPTGCGKTSLVRAGLLPVLSPDVVPIYVESTPDQTEARLLRAVRRRRPELDGALGLADALKAIREERHGPSPKICLILDQFEQWLHGRPIDGSAELLQALRHCDGQHVQCVLMVRDDFWLAVSRFMRELEVLLVEGGNAALVDLFDLAHARKVLLEFGRAFGRLPLDRSSLSVDESAFLDDAVASLAEDGKVVAVRLALFAEMMKTRPWSSATLREVGGAAGLGATFLEETFSAPAAPAGHRLHQAAARGVLAALLPDGGTQIKGKMRSRGDLLAAAGCEGREKDFDDLMRLLDSGLRLVTPTTPDGALMDSATGEVSTSGRFASVSLPAGTLPIDGAANSAAGLKATSYYQLAHDYLVPSLREWLTRKQRQTFRGRCELRLAERAAAWHAQPQPRNLPNWWEWAGIRLSTDRRRWTDHERRMMSGAGRYYGLRMAAVAVMVAGAVIGAVTVRANLDEQRRIDHAQALVSRIASAEIANLPSAIEELTDYRKWADPLLRALAGGSPAGSKEALHAGLALLPADASQLEALAPRLDDCTLDEFAVLRVALSGHSSRLVPELWRQFRDGAVPPPKRFRAGLALAAFDPQSPEWTRPDHEFLAAQLTGANPDDQRALRRELRPIAERLIVPLEAVFAGEALRDGIRESAAVALADFAGHDAARLANLLSQATPPQFAILHAAVKRQPAVRPQAVAALLQIVAERPAGDHSSQDDVIRAGQRRAGAAITALLLGEREAIWPVFEVGSDAESLTQFVHRLKDRGIEPKVLLECLDRATDERVRFGLLLALGEFGLAELPAEAQTPLTDRLVAWYASDPGAAIHSAAGWLLRHWGQADRAREIDQRPIDFDPAGRRNWLVQKIGDDFLTMIVERPTEGVFGSAEHDRGREPNEPPVTPVRVTSTLAVSDREVSRALFEKFQKATGQKLIPIDRWSPTVDHPMVAATWYESVAFCRWLTREAGLSEADQCYPDPGSEGIERITVEGGALVPRDWPVDSRRSGFRLPSELEWELACRNGTTTAYSFGADMALLKWYGLYFEQGVTKTIVGGELRPSLGGLFDMHGNVLEWCHDWWGDFPRRPEVAAEQSMRVIRGGAWDNGEKRLRSSYRNAQRPFSRLADGGIRVVRTLIPGPE